MTARKTLSTVVSMLAIVGSARIAAGQGSGCAPECAGTCGTVVPPGTIVNATWTLAGSPYCVIGDIQVSLLTIQPGVCVLVDGAHEIEVLSTINASGTADQPITFSAKNHAVRWHGITFQNTQPGSVLRHCRISYSDSAAIRIVDSTPAIENCLIESNTNAGPGGGVTATIASGDLLVRNCKILGNTSTGSGGGISAAMGSGTLRLQGCIVANNAVNPAPGVTGGGGGVVVSGSSDLENCSFSGNVVNVLQTAVGASAAIGGGLYASSGTSAISNCTFSANLASGQSTSAQGAAFGRGGAIYQGSGTVGISNSILGCNLADGDNGSQGSGIYVAAGTLSIVNSTIARGNVQGIFRATGTVEARNSILYFNNGGAAQIQGTVTAEYCDIQGGYPGTGNIVFNPAFGGTGCEISDLLIVQGSACTDAGDPTPVYDDVCFPPSLGAVRNDVGAHGGPGGCNWVNQNALLGAVTYCESTRNSSGRPARMSWCGSTSIGANDLTLIATDCPANKFGFFFYGYTEDHAPLGNGWRCIKGTIGRFHPSINTGATGTASRAVDYASLPAVLPITPGSVRRFQFWYRDPPDGGAQTNLSNGLEAFFGP